MKKLGFGVWTVAYTDNPELVFPSSLKGEWFEKNTADIAALLQRNGGPGRAFFVDQPHKGKIVAISESAVFESLKADAIFVDSEGVAAGIITADCLPLVVTAPEKAIVLHVSRKSLLEGLLDRVAERLDVQTINNVFIGPHICDEHFVFEWEGEELKKFRDRFPNAVEQASVIHISLRKAVQTYLEMWGVTADKVHEENRCTFEDEALPSYRRALAQGKGKNFSEFATFVWRRQ